MLLTKENAKNLLGEYLKKCKSTSDKLDFKIIFPQKDNWGVYIQGNPLGATNSFCGFAFINDKVFFKIWDCPAFIENRVEFIKHIKDKKDLLIEYTDKNVSQEKELSYFKNWEVLNKSDYCQIVSKPYLTIKQAKEKLAKIFSLFIDFISWQRNENISGDLLIPVNSKDDLIKNMENTELLFQEKNLYLRNRIIRGNNYVYYKFNGEDRFLPSRYVGYKNISIAKHKNAINKHGGTSDKAITSIIGENKTSSRFEDMLKKFIIKTYGKGFSPKDYKHSFWETDIRLYSENKTSITRLEDEFDKEVAKINHNRTTPPDFRHYGELKQRKLATRMVLYQERDPQVVADALWLAKGVCQGCGADKNNLFERASDGTVYLEVHHIDFLSEGGRDTLDNAVALCPTCHRLMHYGKETDKEKIRKRINKSLEERKKIIDKILTQQ